MQGEFSLKIFHVKLAPYKLVDYQPLGIPTFSALCIFLPTDSQPKPLPPTLLAQSTHPNRKTKSALHHTKLL
jgi:hypothetical protein